jgi:hypothetical protein
VGDRPRRRGIGLGACAWFVPLAASCGEINLPQRGSSAGEASGDSWDDPWGVRDTDDTEEDEPRGHAARVLACEDMAHWERLFARDDEDRLFVERDRLACLIDVNEDATHELRDDRVDPTHVDTGVAEHRGFGDLACGLLAAAWAEPREHRWTQCIGDMELALATMFGAHGGLENRAVSIGHQPWLYDCDGDFETPQDDGDGDTTQADAFVDCIELAVTRRFERIARELALVDAGLPEDIDVLRHPRVLADLACAAFLEPARRVSCPADWLILGRYVVDRHVDPPG